MQPVVQSAWTNSVLPAKEVVENRFQRLIYSGQQVQVHQSATAQAISQFLQTATRIDSSIDTSNTDLKQKDLINKPQLEKFLETHCKLRQFSFQVKKCGDDICEFGVCKPPRLPQEIFNCLNWLPDPIHDDDSPGHYKGYHSLKGIETSEDHCPSLQSKSQRDTSLLQEQGCSNSFFTAQRVRLTVICTECSKPRCIYSQTALSSVGKELLLRALEEHEYSCGSTLLPPEHSLNGNVFIRTGQRCANPVELCYYSCKQGFQGVCCYCADAEAHKPQEFLRNFHTVLPICDACRASKPVVTRMPKAGIKRKKTFCQTLNV